MMTNPLNQPHKVTQKPAARWWVLSGALLVTSILPCPECGTPLGWHIWPLLPLFAVIRLALRRAPAGEPTPADNVVTAPVSEETRVNE